MFKRTLLALALALLFVAADSLLAQNTSDDTLSQKVDSLVQSQLKDQRIPGLALAVVRDGKVVKAAGYGLANVELNVTVTPETLFQTGSVGKQFTATAVMMLVEQQKIALDDRITKYFDNSPPQWNSITIRQLLAHTSGIPDYTDAKVSDNDPLINLRKDYTEDELLREYETMQLEFVPGTKWKYSNTNYALLGFLIHKVTGEFYGDYLHQHIFAPLGMSSTRIISERDIIPNRAAGYELVGNELKNQDWVSPSLNTTADGSLYTNVLDMAKWDAALYTEQLLKKSSLEQMWTPVRLANGMTYPYGFGWEFTRVEGHRVIEHSGAWQGFTTQISRYVDDRLTVVVLTNLDSDHSRPDKIVRQVAALYLPPAKFANAGPSSSDTPASPITDAEAAQLFRKVFVAIAQGDPYSAVDEDDFFGDNFTDAFEAELNDDRLTAFASEFSGLGTLKSAALVHHSESTGQEGFTLEHYVFRCQFPSKSVDMEMSIELDGKVAQIGMEEE
jgi:CubicO group peptidase (beta-lactamase class C family)